MKVLGIGVDIIANKRIKSSIKNSKFINRIYSANELKQSYISKNKTSYFSKRFCKYCRRKPSRSNGHYHLPYNAG